MIKEKYIGPLVSCGVLVMGLATLEVGFRLWAKPPDFFNERNTLFRYDPELGWSGKPNFKGTYTFEGNLLVHVEHNSMGFRDPEHGLKKSRRLAILGDSYTYGFGLEQRLAYPELLRRKFPSWQILNLGIIGYGTDQQYLLMQKYFDKIQPDAVLVVFCPNDYEDNSSNRRYSYYKPYFTKQDGTLTLQGQPPPKNLSYFVATYPWLFKSFLTARLAQNIWHPIAKHVQPTVTVPNPTNELLLALRNYVETRGARFAIGFIQYGPSEKAFCKANHLTCFANNSPHVFKTEGCHWNERGHREVADQIAQSLMKAGWTLMNSK